MMALRGVLGLDRSAIPVPRIPVACPAARLHRGRTAARPDHRCGAVRGHGRRRRGADVAAVLPAFEVFALPSRHEGLPIAVAGAMASGVPVVATAVSAGPDLVEPGVTGLLVPPDRPQPLASAVGHLLYSPAEAARMARAARRRIGARYRLPALRSALEAAYSSRQ